MLLKRHHDAEGKVTAISVRHTGTSPAQNFSTSLVDQLAMFGFAEVVGDELRLHVKPETLRYAIKRRPGKYEGEQINHYECVLDAAQHARFKAVPGALAPSMSHTAEA
jgi:hypothetical protein